MTETAYVNASGIFGASNATALIQKNGVISYVGTDDEALSLMADNSSIIDLSQGFVLPGIVEAHTHLLQLGQSLSKVDLLSCSGQDAIMQELRRFAESKPSSARILARGWLAHARDPAPHRSILDAFLPHTPVYIDANDLHSVWVNSAALTEMGLDNTTPDPADGELERDEHGNLTGLLRDGAAFRYAWGHLAKVATDEEKAEALETAFSKYLTAGVTSAVDMAFSEDDLVVFENYMARNGGQLPLKVRVHWLVHLENSLPATLLHVERAAEVARRLSQDTFAVNGIKVMVDGVLDSCTAALVEPFTNGAHPAPMWTLDCLSQVVAAAEHHNLQVAFHAIGDAASDLALDALEKVAIADPERSRRHRIEHLEVVSRENVGRLARLGVIASMQPVHADPAIGDHALAMLGPERSSHVCTWKRFVEAGATLAFGTDAPTAPHEVLPSLYVATTRRSAIDRHRPAFHPEYAVSLEQAITSSTANSAYASYLETEVGILEPGYRADFAVLDSNPFLLKERALLQVEVKFTAVGGRVVFQSPEPAS